MVVRNRRNTRFFWVMIVVLVVALYYAAVAGATVDKCGPGAREQWDWVPPPHWRCGIGSPH